MKLQAIVNLGLLLALASAANAQTPQSTRAELPAPDSFLGIANFARQVSIRQVSQFNPDNLNAAKLQAIERELAKLPIPR